MIQLMSIFAALMSSALADTPTNQTFSGQFQIVSCRPACEQIVAQLGGGTQLRFAKSEGLVISVIDKTPIVWQTCDGSKVAYEFNLFSYGQDANGTFMHNNLASDNANPWRNICDGKFGATAANVTLKSPRVELDLKLVSGDRYELNWRDDRYKFSGIFELKKTK